MKALRYAVLGFLSVYLIWIIPSWIFGWKQKISAEEDIIYLVGDHLLLPLFNAVAFAMLTNKKGVVLSRGTLLFAFILAVAIAAALFFFDPNTLSVYRTEVSGVLELYHVIFIFLELSFIVFVLGVFPVTVTLKKSSLAPLPLSMLYLIVFAFVSLVLFSNQLPLWKPTVTLSIIFLAWAFAIFHRKIILADTAKKSAPPKKQPPL